MEFLLILCFSLIISFSSGADTISSNKSLSGNQTIISKGGNFELGFFKAVLLDDGNLVLRDGSKSVEPVWKSFDHPAHAWLPGAKLGYDYRTNKSQLLTSWRSNEDPGVGLFSFEFIPSTMEYISKWNGSQQYWTTGPWNTRIFTLLPVMSLNDKKYFYNFSYFSNENESYFTYSVYNPINISGFVMDVSGQVQQLRWFDATKQWNLLWAQPSTLCEVYALCGPFGACRQTGRESGWSFCHCLMGFIPKLENDWNQSIFSGGCVRKTNLECGNNKDISFLTVEVERLPKNSVLMLVGSGEECHTTCLNSCRCSAYSFSDNNQCLVWDVELMDLSKGNFNTETIYVKVASKDLPTRFHEKSNPGVVIGSVAGGILVLGLVLFMIYRKKRMLVGKTTMEGSLVSFGYRELQIATKNFTEKLGGGGFGSVFKGVLRDSSIVAVKKLESVSQGEKQFRSEVSTIGTVQHVNLIHLHGFCAQGSSKLLVYDYMPNGSLDSHLFHEKQDNILNWKTRFQIAVGIAKGLVYLHEKCRDCIIHCDIKPENILLDADFCPKVADFGLAKLVGRDFSRVLTTMRGTRGYLAPEWLSGVPITAKADVYSYGMLLFELVHGKRNVEQYHIGSSTTFFPSVAANVVTEGGDILSLVDSRLNREASVEEVTKVFKVAYWCIQDEEDSRPSMSQVERILEGVVDVSMPPIPQTVRSFWG